jgi:hypothetical protein
MNLLTILVALQRLPIVNRIPAIANAVTLDAALKGVVKAGSLVAAVAAAERAVVGGLTAAITTLEEQREEAQAVADRAERIARRFEDLLA